MLARFHTVAIEDLHAIPRQPGGPLPAQRGEQRPQRCGTIPHQCRRGGRLDSVERVVDRDEQGTDRVFLRPIRRTD
ncbi:MAG: hypothetical protein FJZ47_22470 [Candidatus Tectomicrobia bacterium]|uniref:Uncharacterized protein n=1 Tax=Tectimicrobiota bacterium TaxID=2528274 RepID=A0A937W5G0_UNCTE|nr:hypothetical protein [Candidatus Tectomicrobia bacterium]